MDGWFTNFPQWIPVYLSLKRWSRVAILTKPSAQISVMPGSSGECVNDCRLEAHLDLACVCTGLISAMTFAGWAAAY